MKEYYQQILDEFEEQIELFHDTWDETLDDEVSSLILKSRDTTKFLSTEEVLKCMMLYKGLPDHVKPMLFRIERS